MPVSKRLRFEILRRDNHTCRYCGGTSPEVRLTVDHVVPVALGGPDDPTNLVAACADCNSGKTSTSPDAETVEDVAQDAVRWSAAIERASELHRQQGVRLESFREAVEEEWDGAFAGYLTPYYEPDRGWHRGDNTERTYDWVVYDFSGGDDKAVYVDDTEEAVVRWIKDQYSKVPRKPDDWDVSFHLWVAAGIDEMDVSRAIDRARGATHVHKFDKYRYFCGIIWRTIEDRQKIASELVQADEGDA